MMYTIACHYQVYGLVANPMGQQKSPLNRGDYIIYAACDYWAVQSFVTRGPVH